MDDKYLAVLKEYDTNLDDEKINERVAEIIEKKFDENNNIEVYKKIYSCLDLTSLNVTDSREDIWRFTEKVNDFEGSSDISNVAAICVYPNFVETVRESLTAQDVKIASVSASFPTSQTFIEVKVAETALAVANGADEIDVVINLGMFLSRNYEEMCEEIEEVKHACRDAQLKVILETGMLKNASKIKKASILAMYSGADFLKTSTGKNSEGASLKAAYVMCQAIKEYNSKYVRKVGFKAAGGITTVEDAVKYYTIVKEVLGEEWCDNTLFRIGASRLADSLLKSIG
ncbi:deoxyribose-phosphate aldolase [Dysgonomonas sp. 216]|uniref:deoxyribose-phosphate aldolase n=1 Tax=Dysgonomonas sp. 216 TaxID=2302934 RepID=UPI00351AA246